MSCRRGLLLVVLAAAVLLSACRVRTDVVVDVAEDGSGTVEVVVVLDAEAADRLGDPAAALRTDDLVAAGWDVAEPSSDEDGRLTLRASRRFASPAELPGVLEEIGGVDGVFRGTELVVVDGFNSTSYDFTTSVELSGNPEQFGDELLTASLGGLPLGRTPEELAFEGAADPGTATLRMVVELPGGAPDTDGEIEGDRAVWELPMTGGEPTSQELRSASTLSGSGTWTLFVLGATALVLAVGLAIVGVVRRRA